MADSVYRVTEVIGVSSDSWEAAARNAVETAAKTVRDLRVAEVLRQDVTIENGKQIANSTFTLGGQVYKYAEDGSGGLLAVTATKLYPIAAPAMIGGVGQSPQIKRPIREPQISPV